MLFLKYLGRTNDHFIHNRTYEFIYITRCYNNSFYANTTNLSAIFVDINNKFTEVLYNNINEFNKNWERCVIDKLD